MFLGISKSRVYHLTSSREIPHYKQGKSVYFKKSELEEWMTSDKVRTDAEVRAEAIEARTIGFKK